MRIEEMVVVKSNNFIKFELKVSLKIQNIEGFCNNIIFWQSTKIWSNRDQYKIFTLKIDKKPIS